MHTEQIEIRETKPADACEMSRLAAELGYPMTTAEMERRMACLSESPRHGVFVAASGDGRLIGWMHVEHRVSLEGGERGELMGLVVDKAARRMGIGRRLVKVAEEWVAARGVRELVVRSNVARELSHRFYRALGFALVKTQHVYAKTVATGEDLA